MRSAKTKPKASGGTRGQNELRPFYLVWRAGLAIRAAVDAFGAGEGITLSKYTLLSMIDSSDQFTTSRLARSLEITPQSVHQMIMALHAEGLIARTSSATDKRNMDLALTDLGRKKLELAERAVDQAREYLFQDIPEEDRAKFLQGLLAMTERGRMLSANTSQSASIAAQRATRRR